MKKFINHYYLVVTDGKMAYYTQFIGGKSGTKEDGYKILKDVRKHIRKVRKAYKKAADKDLPELLKSPLINSLSFYLNAKKKIKDVYIIQYGQRDRVSLKHYDGTEGHLIFKTIGLEALVGDGPNKISTPMNGDAYFIGRINGKVGYIKLEDGNAEVRISADDAPEELSRLQLIARRNQDGDIEIVNIGKNKVGIYR